MAPKARTAPRKLPQQERSRATIDAILTATARILMREGFDPEFGARPLRRAIQTYVDDALADAILAGELQPGQTATLSVVDGAVRVTATGEARIQQAAQPMRAA